MLHKKTPTTPNAPHSLLYCQNCAAVINLTRCPLCGRKKLREPKETDPCFLTEREVVWAGVLADLLTQNNIPFYTTDMLGAGISARIGIGLERTRFFVPYSFYSDARDIVHGFLDMG